MNKRLKLAWYNPPADKMFYEYNLTWMYIKTYMDCKSPHKNSIDWIEPIYKWHDINSVEESIEKFKDADVILFSSYIWNYSVILKAAEYVKRKYPHILTVIGGPQSEWNAEDFLLKFWMFDYHCDPTSPAEVYIYDWVNSWFEDGVPQHEKISYDKRSDLKKTFEYLDVSIYEHNKEYLQKAKKYFDKLNITPRIAWESTRGCPFKCTFCEWGGGTGTKLKKKPLEVVEKDLDCLSELGFEQIDLIDSNLGAFRERDREIIQLIGDRNLEIMQTSILKTKDLERKKEISDQLFDAGQKITISVQSYSQEALANAKRPDLSLDQQFELIAHIRKRIIEKHGEEFFDKPIEEIVEVANIEFIMGMPGSTKEDFYQEYHMMELMSSWYDGRFEYNYLPNTEAFTKEDLEKYEVELLPIYSTNIFGTKNYFHTIKSCYSYTVEDMYEMYFMNLAGNYLRKNVYDNVKDKINIAHFFKMCYNILSELEDFKFIHNQIINFFDDSEPSDLFNLIDFNGNISYKIDVIEEFIKRNEKELNMLLIAHCYTMLVAS